jgi:hypothetical protein
MSGARLNSVRYVAAVLVLATGAVSAQTNPVVITPPVPTLKSPVESFRALLVMPTAERRQFLATRNTNVQERLVQKIRQYQTLTPEQRELRLKATELRWYLQPLMRAPATNRAAQLALIPEEMRAMVAARLEQWDRIPASVQQMFLTNELGAGYLARVALPTNYPPLPTVQIRQHLVARINQLFDLTPGEQERVLGTLSDAERKQMEKTWEKFQNLSPVQRRQCLLSFKQFTDLAPAERQEFLQNAERWSQMTPAERQAWRELVSIAPNLPPLPNVRVATPPPPLPVRRPGPGVATNGG